jgi:hypothetical protein
VINEPKTYQQPLETQSEHDRPGRASNLLVKALGGGRWTSELYVQFIADERQWCYEPNARDEAEDFGDECVEAAEDEQAAEDRGTDVTATEDRGWVAALYDGMTARRGIYGHAQYGAPGQYCLNGRSRWGLCRDKDMWRTKAAWETSCQPMANSLRGLMITRAPGMFHRPNRTTAYTTI